MKQNIILKRGERFTAGNVSVYFRDEEVIITYESGVPNTENEHTKKFPPKDGDVLISDEAIIIYRKGDRDNLAYCYACLDLHTETSDISDFNVTNSEANWGHISEYRYATDSEKQIIFDAMAEKGFKWNAEEKRVEKIHWRTNEGEEYCFNDEF